MFTEKHIKTLLNWFVRYRVSQFSIMHVIQQICLLFDVTVIFLSCCGNFLFLRCKRNKCLNYYFESKQNLCMKYETNHRWVAPLEKILQEYSRCSVRPAIYLWEYISLDPLALTALQNLAANEELLGY